MKMVYEYSEFQTALGPMTIAGDNQGITHLFFNNNTFTEFNRREYVLNSARFSSAVKIITGYLAGKNNSLANLKWKLGKTGTDFQRKVWGEMRKVKPGSTRTYGEIALGLGGKKYSRAVGGACNANPVLLLIPCHRIVSSGRGLGGFALGPVMKEKLLSLES